MPDHRSTLEHVAVKTRDGAQECVTWRHEALYHADRARQRGDYEAEAAWRQQAEAWLIQASHHAKVHDTAVKVIGSVAVA